LNGDDVDEYLTDQQQAEKLRRWWKENGAFVIAGLVIGVGGLFGWRQWEDYKLEQAENASAVYEQLILAIGGNRGNEAAEQLLVLSDEYSRSPYIDQARLAMAKMHMDRNSPAQAAEELELLLAESDNAEFQHIARLRLAKIRLHQGDYDAALASLAPGAPSAFVPQYHDVRGDVFFGMGRFDEARAEYEQALFAAAPGVIERALVQAKLDDLGPVPLNLVMPAAEPTTNGDDSVGSLPDAAADKNSQEDE
jgi:predicted negative regulator of RcsB-dependent stress response